MCRVSCLPVGRLVQEYLGYMSAEPAAKPTAKCMRESCIGADEQYGGGGQAAAAGRADGH